MAAETKADGDSVTLLNVEETAEAPGQSFKSGHKQFPWKSAGKLALELVVVFAGVFLASLVDQWKASQTQKANQREVLSLLEESYRYQAQKLTTDSAGFHQSISDFIKRYDDGDMPQLIPEYFASGLDSGFWNVMLATGTANGLDPKLLFQIQIAESAARVLLNRANQINELTFTVLDPNMGQPHTEFYDEATKKLRPKYQWYIDSLTAFDTQFQHYVESNRALLKTIEEAKERM